MTILTFPEIIVTAVPYIPYSNSTAPDQRFCLHTDCWQDTGGLWHCRHCGLVFYQDSGLNLVPL